MGMGFDIRNGNGTEECMEVIGNKREPKGIGLGGGGQRKKKVEEARKESNVPSLGYNHPFFIMRV